MAKRLEGRSGIITGGASGIGKAIAMRFAAEGAAIVVADIHEKRGAEIVAEIEKTGGRAVFANVDVRRSEDCERVVALAVARFGKLDIMVNNAGIGRGAAIAELLEEDWDAVLAVNLKGVYLGSKFAFRAMARNGGVILNMASVAGIIAAPGFAAYGAAKAGVIHLTKITALEGAAFNIRANALCPTWIDTPLLEAALQRHPDLVAGKQEMAAGIPLGRIGQPEDVASAALYLASDDAAFITGVAFPVDGGTTVGAFGSAPRRRPARRKQDDE